MIKLVKRSTRRAASAAILAERVDYISDHAHPDHKNKTIYPAKNYNCPNNSSKTFIDQVHKLEEAYRQARKGKRGKRSPRLFEEVVYSSPHGGNLTALERESVEAMLINLFARTTACRTAWHVDQVTGRADLHVFLAAKNLDYPPRLTLWADYGGEGGRHIYAEFDKLDSTIANHLNGNPNRKTKLKSASKIHKERVGVGNSPSLAQEIAAVTKDNVTIANIGKVITSLGHSVPKTTSRSISVIFAGRKKPRRFNLEDLLADIASAQSSPQKPDSPGSI